jgi:cyclopropane-fatty-acyl-phospholipid synthase
MFEKLFLIFLKNRKFKGILRLSFGRNNYVFGEKLSPMEINNLIDEIDINVLDSEFFKRVILFGDTGVGESFFLHEFETEDIKKLLLWFVQNKESLPGFRKKEFSDIFFEWGKILLKISHSRNKNTIEGSKRNIKAHYDVSNDFYALWLDNTMSYSSAVFGETEDLETAQINKYKKICENINIKKGDNILEIGSGWWGFAIYAASNYECHVTTVTISDEQFVFAKKRIKEKWLDDKITIKLMDYRELEGPYDKIVSIEMMEALWYEFVPWYLAKCNSLLKEWWKACLQFITYPDEHFDTYLKNTDFIQKYIFPGGELLSLNQVKNELAKNDLTINLIENIGLDYAKTLNIWRSNFVSKKKEIMNLGFSEEDFRMWLYYFVYCEVGFETEYIDDIQLVFEKKQIQQSIVSE